MGIFISNIGRALLLWQRGLIANVKLHFFFLVGDNFISSEDSSPIEYTESGPKGVF